MTSIIIPRSAPRICPHCESEYVTHSRRQGILALPLIRLLRICRYRCTDCWRHFYGFSRS